jgi:hypothetical protein
MPEAPNLTRADHTVGMSWSAIDLNLLIEAAWSCRSAI